MTDEQIRELLTAGRTVPEVAAVVGMTARGVYARLRRHPPSRDLYRRLPRQSEARTFDRFKAVTARRRTAEERFPPAVRQQLVEQLTAGTLLRDFCDLADPDVTGVLLGWPGAVDTPLTHRSIRTGFRSRAGSSHRLRLLLVDECPEHEVEASTAPGAL